MVFFDGERFGWNLMLENSGSVLSSFYKGMSLAELFPFFLLHRLIRSSEGRPPIVLILMCVFWRKMDEMSVVNASCLLLFESSGDSESVSDTLLPEINEDDDAHSVSDDLSELQSFNGCDVKSCTEYEDEDEAEEWSGEDVGSSVSSQKSSASVDSTKGFELLNEMEKSRLFWETCLQS